MARRLGCEPEWKAGIMTVVPSEKRVRCGVSVLQVGKIKNRIAPVLIDLMVYFDPFVILRPS
ncbi:hypothetical protein VIM7927_01178 [Vibrio mangrovi]|uniref:Uncharacterized protein n=1 Tax=Vibrio mangrovi TaxID=474394 RepID=A0A1Y6ISZ8_9VIBR|nr:hypothetical protein VIM7927_01178 [Vibrio mangrovi]